VSSNPYLLRVLHLASPALPIGSFHFSQAMEYAVEAGWVCDERTALEWVGGLAQNALGTLDLPILARLHCAWSSDDLAAVTRWNALLTAARETEELRAEDRHMGNALQKILVELKVFDRDAGWPEAGVKPQRFGYAAMFALACARWSVPVVDALQAYAWAWAENQVLAAIKLVPLGQTAGQRMLHTLAPHLAVICDTAMSLEDDDLGVCSVMHAMASARHELQYTRLFRS
jgi:urease accessory protein